MFAGKMKLSTFAIVAILALGVCGVGTAALFMYGLFDGDSSSSELLEHVEPAAAAPIASPGPITTVVVPAAEPATQAVANTANSKLRAWDKVVFDNQGRNLGSDKLKDVSKGQSWKVNLYQDAGQASMNRAKVDLDRDDKWDEKYTLEAGTILRQVAPADDENYTETYRWSGTDWVRE